MTTSPDVRLSLHHKLLLHAVASVLFLSGGVAAAYDLLVYFERDELMSLAIKSWSLMIHGGAAMVFLILFGTLLPIHVKRAWQACRNRLSGSLLIAVIVTLIITGYGLYYIGREDIRTVMMWVHLILGIGEPLFFISHLLRGRATRPPELTAQFQG